MIISLETYPLEDLIGGLNLNFRGFLQEAAISSPSPFKTHFSSPKYIAKDRAIKEVGVMINTTELGEEKQMTIRGHARIRYI